MSEPNPIRVLIVDDHAVVRSGLSAFLLACDDMELVGEAAGGREAVRRCMQRSILSKLNVANRTEAVALALQNHLVP